MSAVNYPSGKNKPVVIVEIGNDWLKIVEGKVARTGISIAKASFKKIAQIKGPVAENTAQIWDQLKFHKQNVIPYIPRHLITVRILELPSTNLAEISQMINLQIGKQTPYSKDEIVFTYQVIDSFKVGYTKVMLAIAKRNIINERMDILRKAGVRPQRVTLSSEGVYHWFKAFHLGQLKNENAQEIILVDIDSNYADFIFIHQGKFAFTKNILIGANHLADAEGGQQQKFIDELVHSRDVCQEEWKGIKPTKIFLSGAIKDVKNIGPILSERLEMPCEIIDTAKDVDIAHDEAVSVSPIIGFLLKQQDVIFNLIPGEMRIEKLMEDKRKDLTVVGVLLSAIVLMLSLLVFIHIDQKNDYLVQLKAKLAQVTSDSNEVDRMRLSINVARERIDAKGDCLTLLNDIYKILPEKIFLTALSIERKGRISLKGQAATMSEVFRFINKLEGMSNLKNVQNTYATINRESENGYSTDFEITAAYNDKK